jgi:predicted DNA-binding ribbon-helix-helix protein
MTLSDLIHEIDEQRRHGNLSSAIRLFVLKFYRSQASEKVGDRLSARRRPLHSG